MEHIRKILQAKIETRYHSRELIRVTFVVTDNMLVADKEGIGPALRKKVLAISSFLSHGTVKQDKDEQNEDFLTVMAELREVLKLVTIGHHLGYFSATQKNGIRTAIATVIDALDKLVILLGT